MIWGVIGVVIFFCLPCLLFFPLLPPSKSQDNKISKQEILDNWNMFVGSQATNYGEDLTKDHDEL